MRILRSSDSSLFVPKLLYDITPWARGIPGELPWWNTVMSAWGYRTTRVRT